MKRYLIATLALVLVASGMIYAGSGVDVERLDWKNKLETLLDTIMSTESTIDGETIADGTIDNDALATAVQDQVAYITVTGADAGSSGTGTITIQAKDAGGNDLAALVMCRTWIGTADDLEHDALTDYSVSTGTEREENVADADYTVVSDTNGVIVMAVDKAGGAAGSVYAWAELGGRIVASGEVELTAP